MQPFGAGLLTGDDTSDIVFNNPSNGETRIFNTVTSEFEPLSAIDPDLSIPGFNVRGVFALNPNEQGVILLQAQPGSTGPLPPGAVTYFNRASGEFGEVLAVTAELTALV